MYVVRRALDDNGNKMDDKYVVVEGTVKTIKPMIDEYDCTNLVMNFYDSNEEEKFLSIMYSLKTS